MTRNEHRTAEDQAIIDGLHNARALNQGWDSTDYRAMLRREQDNRNWAGCYERPGQYVARLEAHPDERY